MTTRTCIYDRISERRLAQEEKQRLLEARFPKGDFASTCVSIVQAWVWLPCGAFEAPLPASELAGLPTDFSHDPRLLDERGLRRPVRRLATPAAERPDINALRRSSEILQAALNKWAPALRDSIDWPNTQVVLFVPGAVRAMDWFDRVVTLWPHELLPHRGFDLQTQVPAQWLPELLVRSAGAQYLLCLSLDTWACKEQLLACLPDQMAGEAVSAVLLRRESKSAQLQTDSLLKLFAPVSLGHAARTAQDRNDTQTLEQLMAELGQRTTIDPSRVKILIGDGALEGQRLNQLNRYVRDFLPTLDLERQIRLSTIGARFGPATEQWVQIGLAWLTASAEPDSAAWILDRTQADRTQGWFIG
jgi:muconolactone delta-isomerase